MPPFVLRTDPKLRFLKGLERADLKEVLAAAKPRHIPAHSVVVQQERPADRVFLLTKGRARYFYVTEEGRKLALSWLVPGDIFGGAALLAEPSWFLVSTETVKDSEVLVWERSVMQGLVARYPRLLQNALLVASDYLVWYLATHIGLICRTADQRFASVLLTLAHSIGQKGPRGMELDVTNEELASAAAVTPFTASRLMSQWQRSGAVLKSRGRVVVCAPEKLLSSGGKKPEND